MGSREDFKQYSKHARRPLISTNFHFKPRELHKTSKRRVMAQSSPVYTCRFGGAIT